MSDFIKKLKKGPVQDFVRQGFDAVETGWKKTRIGWLPSAEVADPKKQTLIFATRLILEDEGKILFLRQTATKGGRYSLPGGNVEESEFAREALCREAFEETGIRLTPDRLTLAHVLHRRKRETGEIFIVFYFKAVQFKGEPVSQEPHKFDHAIWVEAANLPENISKHTRKVLERVGRGVMYSEMPKAK